MADDKWCVDLSDDEADLVHRTLLYVARRSDLVIKENSQAEISDFALAHTRDRLLSLAERFDFGAST